MLLPTDFSPPLFDSFALDHLFCIKYLGKLFQNHFVAPFIQAILKIFLKIITYYSLPDICRNICTTLIQHCNALV